MSFLQPRHIDLLMYLLNKVKTIRATCTISHYAGTFKRCPKLVKADLQFLQGLGYIQMTGNKPGLTSKGYQLAIEQLKDNQ